MRLADIFLMIPSLFVILVLARIFQGTGGGGVLSLVTVFIAFGWMGIARLVRGQVLAVREMEYVEAARALGVRPIRIALRHILPNAIGPIVVSFPFAVGGAIISEAFISYLGFGVAGGFGGEVDAGVAHARHFAQRPLDPSRAGGAGHAFNRKPEGIGGVGHGCVAALSLRMHPFELDPKSPLSSQGRVMVAVAPSLA
jgi:hypothetical protein